MADVVFIRCHRFGPVEDNLARQLAAFFGADNVALCVDESAGTVDTGSWAKVSLTRDIAAGIVDGYVPDDWGWRMGDLCHIAMAEARPGYDRQWLIESDVHIPQGQEVAILSRIAAIEADFIACALRPKKVKPMAEAVKMVLPNADWGCVFAFNRLATRRVPRLKQIRQEIAAAMKNKKGPRVPNDEAVLCNLAVADGWTIADLWDAAPEIFDRRWFDTNPPWLRRDLDSRTGSMRISHPVLDFAQLARRVTGGGDGHPQHYKAGRLSRILPHLTEDERAIIMPHVLQKEGGQA